MTDGRDDERQAPAIVRVAMIDAPLETVWIAVTDADHLGSWLSDAAEIDLRPGGVLTLTSAEHGTARGRVEKVEPPHAFAFRWDRARALGGETTLVEFVLAPAGSGTRLRVAETGAGHSSSPAGGRPGWDHDLDELRVHLAKQVHAPALAIRRRGTPRLEQPVSGEAGHEPRGR